MDEFKILVIDPGSTSTKVGIYFGDKAVVKSSVRHSLEELGKFGGIPFQKDFRKQIVLNVLAENNIQPEELDIVIGRGGLVKKISSGTYEINQQMVDDALYNPVGQHACNLGPIIAYEIAQMAGVIALTADPATMNDMPEVARLTGLPEIKRLSTFHALNQRAMARKYAEQQGRTYESMNLVVAHMGGGISIGVHQNGKVIDVNNGLDGDGPFSPERAGSLPSMQLAELCYSGKYTLREMSNKLAGEGGILSYIGTNDMIEIERRCLAGDKKAILMSDAMSYNIGKWIGASAAVLHGKVDAIILTGGIAYDRMVCNYIGRMVSYIAPIVVMPGEDELEALAMNALRVLNGKTVPKVYPEVEVKGKRKK